MFSEEADRRGRRSRELYTEDNGGDKKPNSSCLGEDKGWLTLRLTRGSMRRYGYGSGDRQLGNEREWCKEIRWGFDLPSFIYCVVMVLFIILRLYHKGRYGLITLDFGSVISLTEKLKKSWTIRARFRSWDLWVMGPPRFRCATLIYWYNYYCFRYNVIERQERC